MLEVRVADQVLRRRPLYAATEVGVGGLLSRAVDAITSSCSVDQMRVPDANRTRRSAILRMSLSRAGQVSSR